MSSLKKKNKAIIYRRYYVHLQVLDLSSAAMTTVPSPPEPAAGAYKAAVGDFIHSDSGSRSTLGGTAETPLPEVDELKTEALQQLMASAKTLTAREDLLSTLRLEVSLYECRLWFSFKSSSFKNISSETQLNV